MQRISQLNHQINLTEFKLEPPPAAHIPPPDELLDDQIVGDLLKEHLEREF